MPCFLDIMLLHLIDYSLVQTGLLYLLGDQRVQETRSTVTLALLHYSGTAASPSCACTSFSKPPRNDTSEEKKGHVQEKKTAFWKAATWA